VIRFLADEDFNNDILRGVLRRTSGLDVARVQDIGPRGADGDAVLRARGPQRRVNAQSRPREVLSGCRQDVAESSAGLGYSTEVDLFHDMGAAFKRRGVG
jgi:hypothetical protein